MDYTPEQIKEFEILQLVEEFDIEREEAEAIRRFFIREE